MISLKKIDTSEHVAQGKATVNPCTLCAPLGAVLASAGVRGAIPLLHGAQGCATYIRRYLISHFREPMDVASSSFGEAETVMGGESNLHRALNNVASQYHPELVTVATTCLAETIGEDVERLLRLYRQRHEPPFALVAAHTPSFKDGHAEGFHTMVRSLVQSFATERGSAARRVNILPPILSPADLRHLREIGTAYGLATTILPDYSDSLDGVIRAHYSPLPPGGTPLSDIAVMPRSALTCDFTLTGRAPRASALLEDRGSPVNLMGLPIGVRACDAFAEALTRVAGVEMPACLIGERGRLLDAYADGHKYVFGKRVAVYGDPELVVGLVRFLLEIGAKPVIAATGARNRALFAALTAVAPGKVDEILDDTDFVAIEAACRRTRTEVLMGSSKGYRMARRLGVPLLRVGFPVHDRLGAGRILHVGYRGTLRLFDALVNTLLAVQQDASDVGFSYL
jgi:nitrogenase molybdenum-iron protein NifN